MPDTPSCSLSNADYQRQLAEQAAAEQSDGTCHDNKCEAPPAKPAVPACRDERNVKTEEAAAGYKPTRASTQLAHKARAKAKAHKAAAHGAARKSAGKPPTDTNAERTMARRPAPYAEAGVTSSGDSVYIGVAGAKGKDGQGAAEVFSASAQVGAQNEFQVGMGRAHLETKSGQTSADMEVFTARAAEGIHNEDGSTGANASIGASVFKFGATTHIEGVELHGAFELGATGEKEPELTHVGVRDPDHDGRYDVCAGVKYGAVELSACLPNLIRW